MDFVPQPVRLKGMPVPAHPWSILKASAEQGEAAAAASLLPARFFRACHACATYGEAGDHYQFFQTLFLQAPWGAPVGCHVAGEECLFCEQRFCSQHAGAFEFPPGALPEGRRSTVCAECLPRAQHIVDDHKEWPRGRSAQAHGA